MFYRLTIALPTFNRQRLLDQQLAWLSQAIKGHEDDLEIIISDNCSDDQTQQVIERWTPAFAKTTLRLNRNSENIGAVRNIARCMRMARGRHVWVISDDDPIRSEAIGYVLDRLNETPDLGLIVLNFSSREVKTGRLNFERCYDIAEEKVHRDGRKLFGELLYQDNGGVTLTTALVYRTDLAHAALDAWPEGLENLAVQMYITGYAAAHGPALATRDVWLECAAGEHYFMSDPKLQHKLQHVDVPRIYARFFEIGYSRLLFLRMFWKKLKRNAHPREFPGFVRRTGVMVRGIIGSRLRRLWQRRPKPVEHDNHKELAPVRS